MWSRKIVSKFCSNKVDTRRAEFGVENSIFNDGNIQKTLKSFNVHVKLMVDTWRAEFGVKNSIGASRVRVTFSLNGCVFSANTLSLVILKETMSQLELDLNCIRVQ
jgi:hypothetical protein